MNQEEIIHLTEKYVYEQLHNDASGHDWWHIVRVTRMARKIAEEEKADLFICEMAALLHDVADEKLNSSEEEGLNKVKDFLHSLEIDQNDSHKIMEIISTISYKGGGQPKVTTLEAMIVQDADRLDAIGAIGIARTLAYGGKKGQLIYDPNITPRTCMTKEAYRNEQSTSINHFYEKLLKLKDEMNTTYGKQMAEERHLYMENFLKQFMLEWNG